MQTRIIERVGELCEELRTLPDWDVAALDCETEPFDFKNPLKSHAWQLELHGIGIYTIEKNFYIRPSALVGSARDLFQDFLDEWRILMHNAKFDLTVIEALGFDVSKVRYEDTMVMASLADENLPSFGLKNLAVQLLGVENVTRFADVKDAPDENAMAEYCLDDCKYTYKLYGIFMESLLNQGLYKVYTENERPFVEVLRSMERIGISIDTGYLEKMGVELEEELKSLEKKIHIEAGHEFDIASVKQLREVLFDEKKYKLPKDFRTPKGEMSTDVEALEYLASAHGSIIASLILKYRELSKINGTYVKGLLAKAVHTVYKPHHLGPSTLPSPPVESTIHASFWQTGTVTGRLSSSEPNLQNIPARKKEEGFDIRAAFKPRPGKVFIDADYSQIELRLMAYYSGCPSMVNTYKTGGDIHQATADAIGCPRSFAKVINFGLNYGMSAYSLSRKNAMPEEEAEKFVNEYFAKFPEVKEFMDKATGMVRENAVVRTISGRLRRFPDYERAVSSFDTKAQHRSERQSVNAIIQGSAADIIKIAMVRLHKALKPHGARILIQVHDELIVECDEDKADEVSRIIRQEMEGAVSLGEVPLTTIPKITKVWEK